MNERPLRIAFLVGKFPSISETFILNQITGLIDAGHHVDIFAKDQPDEPKVHVEVERYGLLERTHYFDIRDQGPPRVGRAIGVLVKSIQNRQPQTWHALRSWTNRRGMLSLRLMSLLHLMLVNGPYDIIHCHFGPMGMYGALLKEVGVPGKLVVTFHGQDISQYLSDHGERVYQPVYEQADLLMPISSFWQERLVALGADPARVYVHRMGIDPGVFPFKPRRLDESGEIRLLTVGRLVEKKGIAFALHAVARALQRHPQWNLSYKIIGSGPQEDDLRALIGRFGLEAKAQLLGSKNRDEIRRQMLNAHIFLLPSVTDTHGDQEGIPVSIMEAMATGLPILSSLHTGIPELVQEGRSGFLLPERDVDGLAGRLEFLILQPERWSEMGLVGRRFVEANYDIHKLNRQLVDCYQSLLLQPQVEPLRKP